MEDNFRNVINFCPRCKERYFTPTEQTRGLVDVTEYNILNMHTGTDVHSECVMILKCGHSMCLRCLTIKIEKKKERDSTDAYVGRFHGIRPQIDVEYDCTRCRQTMGTHFRFNRMFGNTTSAVELKTNYDVIVEPTIHIFNFFFGNLNDTQILDLEDDYLSEAMKIYFVIERSKIRFKDMVRFRNPYKCSFCHDSYSFIPDDEKTNRIVSLWDYKVLNVGIRLPLSLGCCGQTLCTTCYLKDIGRNRCPFQNCGSQLLHATKSIINKIFHKSFNYSRTDFYFNLFPQLYQTFIQNQRIYDRYDMPQMDDDNGEEEKKSINTNSFPVPSGGVGYTSPDAIAEIDAHNPGVASSSVPDLGLPWIVPDMKENEDFFG